MKQTITDYFPAFLTSGGGSTPKDLPCDPEFPSSGSGSVPSGYAPPPKPTPAPAPPPPAPPVDTDGAGPAPSPSDSCGLKPGECDTHDKKGCNCVDSSICCANHGCGGMVGQRQCLPCAWKAWGTPFT